MDENIKEENKRSLRQTLTNNYKVILIAMLLGVIAPFLVFSGWLFEFFRDYFSLFAICLISVTIFCGLLSLIILHISRGSKKREDRLAGTILGVLIVPMGTLFFIFVVGLIFAMASVGG